MAPSGLVSRFADAIAPWRQGCCAWRSAAWPPPALHLKAGARDGFAGGSQRRGWGHATAISVGGDYFGIGSETPAEPSVHIYLAAQYADIFDGATLVGRSSICSGRRSHRTPAGVQRDRKIAEHVSNRYGDYVDENGQIVQANIDALGTQHRPARAFRGTKMPYFLRILGGIGCTLGRCRLP